MSVYKDYTDHELLELLKTDNEEAYTTLYNRHWKFLFTSAYNSLRHKSDSMDICQSVFLWLWENRSQIVVMSNLKGYLYTAVKYKISNLIRQGKIREILLDNILTADIRTEEIKELEIKELEHFIAQLIEDLPGKCKEVFLLSRSQHLSHKEISKRLGISEKTVDNHIASALKKMRAPLDRMATIFLLL